MPREEFLERLKLVRRGLGNLLFHFTKPASANVVIQRGSTTVTQIAERLMLSSRKALIK